MDNMIHILLVDDDAQMRAATRRLLQQELPGVEVVPVADAQAFQDALELGDYQLVITDYELGWGDGLSILHTIKLQKPDCPVIMFTGSGSEEIAVEAMKAGLDDYVLKSPRHLARLAASVRSVLERMRLGRAQRELETKYQSLFEGVPVGLWRITPESEIADANPALLEMMGYTDRESVLGSGVASCWVDPEECQRWLAAMQTGDPPAPFVSRLRRRDGTEFWASIRAHAVRGEQGALLHYEGSVADITERQRRQRELEVVVDLYHHLRSAPTRADMMPVILDHALDLVGAEGAALALRDPDADHLRVELANGGWADWTGERVPSIGGLVAKVMADGQLHVSSDLSSGEPRQTNNLCAVACVPLIAEEETIGALLAGRRADFDDDARGLLSVMGGVAASTIYRAGLHERTAQLNEQLQRWERFINRILESIPSTLIVLDRSLRVVSANRNFLQKSRRRESAVLGRKLREVFPRVLLEQTELESKVREVFRTGKATEAGKAAYRARGIPARIYYYRLLPIRTPEEVENVMLLMDDITEREQLVEEARRAERHLAGVVDCANDVVVSMDPEGNILTWNPAAERISRLSAAEAAGRPLVSLCVPEKQSLMTGMLQALGRGESAQDIEVELVVASGPTVPIAWSCSSMRDDAGTVAGIVAVGHDLTERNRLQAQLLHSEKMSSLGVMAGGIAHELRNPLGVVSAAVQLLSEQGADEDLRGQCISKALSATRRASWIIENLLKFARPRGEQVEEVGINEVLEETFSLLAPQMRLAKATLRRELEPVSPVIYGNASLIQQVFTNLILNACNAMPNGGTLTVGARESDDGHVEIRFTDTGVGIPKENLRDIFDPFFTTMPVGKGTGLGLSITYSIVERHNGTIGVESEAGKGATFTLRLPSVRAVASAAQGVHT